MTPPVTHTELQTQVTQLLTMTGWRYLHVRKSIGTRSSGRRGYMTTTNLKGWPDLAPCWSARQPGRVLALELKVPPDKLSEDQIKVSTELLEAGFEFYVVTPTSLQKLALVLRPGGIRKATMSSGIPVPPRVDHYLDHLEEDPVKEGNER